MTDILVFLLIVSPLEFPMPHAAGIRWWTALKHLARQMEIAGPHERWIDDWRSELGYVRRHYRSLLQAPPLCDAERLPCHEWNVRFRACVEKRLSILHGQRAIRLWQAECYTEMINNLDGTVHALALMETATFEPNSYVVRRGAMAQLRDMIGQPAYYAGQWLWSNER